MRRSAWLLVLLALGAGTCGEDADLPAAWAGARDVVVDQSACGGDGAVSNQGKLVLTRDMAQLRGAYEGAPFRCNQRVCAYRVDQGGTTRVLVQPCEMNPAMVTKCDCLYSVTFTLEEVPAGHMVELHRRWDRYGATEEPAVVLVDRQRAP
jgi:hypothetical protein